MEEGSTMDLLEEGADSKGSRAPGTAASHREEAVEGQQEGSEGEENRTVN